MIIKDTHSTQISLNFEVSEIACQSYLHWKVQFKFRWEFLFGVQAIREIYPPKAAICMDLNTQSLNIVGAIGPPGIISQIQLNLIPTLVQSQWHSAYIWLYLSEPRNSNKVEIT